MATEVVTGLSGTEIKKDYLNHLEKRLDADCNLRAYDSYNRGYSGWIEYHIECYGLDAQVIEGKVTIGIPQDDPDAEIGHGKIEIAQEENLTAVRERIPQEPDQQEATLEVDEEGSIARRKYSKKLPLPSDGGTEEFVE